MTFAYPGAVARNLSRLSTSYTDNGRDESSGMPSDLPSGEAFSFAPRGKRNPGEGRLPEMTSTTSGSTPTASGSSVTLREGAYLTDGTRLLRVLRVDTDGAEVEDARTEQLEWHPVRELASATRAVEP